MDLLVFVGFGLVIGLIHLVIHLVNCRIHLPITTYHILLLLYLAIIVSVLLRATQIVTVRRRLVL